MAKKPEMSGRLTIVLDEDELKELDDATLTTVLRDATNSIKQIEIEDDDEAEDAEKTSTQSE